MGDLPNFTLSSVLTKRKCRRSVCSSSVNIVGTFVWIWGRTLLLGKWRALPLCGSACGFRERSLTALFCHTLNTCMFLPPFKAGGSGADTQIFVNIPFFTDINFKIDVWKPLWRPRLYVPRRNPALPHMDPKFRHRRILNHYHVLIWKRYGCLGPP